MIMLLAILILAAFLFTMVFTFATINSMIDNNSIASRGVIWSCIAGTTFMALLLIFIANT